MTKKSCMTFRALAFSNLCRNGKHLSNIWVKASMLELIFSEVILNPFFLPKWGPLLVYGLNASFPDALWTAPGTQE